MTNINVMFWNIQDFGLRLNYRGNYVDTCNFIAQAVENAQPDIFFLQELHPAGIAFLPILLNALNALPAPLNNWYLDVVRSSIDPAAVGAGGVPVRAGSAYEQVVDLSPGPHNELYIVFFNLNIAKFTMQRAAPLFDPTAAAPAPLLPNTQSFMMHHEVGGAMVPLVADITVPLAAALPLPYTFVNATVPPAGGVAIPAGGAAAGTLIPAGTAIGIGGVLTYDAAGLPIVIIPEGFVLTDNVNLPAVGDVVVPQHSLGLSILGRSEVVAGAYMNYTPFVPGGPYNWGWLRFYNGGYTMSNVRRPAFCTIKANGPAALVDQLIPIHVFHAPSNLGSAFRALFAAASSHSLYQAYDWVGAAWIEPNRVLFGGDFNYPLDPLNQPYLYFTDLFGAGGAQCQFNPLAVPPVEGIRINNGPPPAGGPVANNPDNQTMVNILTWPPPRAPILMTDLDSYRTSAIDNIFCRGFTAAEAPLHPFGGYYHILDAIQNQHFGAVVNPDFQAANIQALLNCYHVAVTGAVFPILPPPPAALAADINNYIAFFAPLAAAVGGGAPLGFYPLPPAAAPAPFVPGTPDPARAAAEFVNLLVSDHMPVLFTMIL